MESNGWISFAQLFEARNFVMKNIKMSIASSLTAFSFSGQLNRFKNDAKFVYLVAKPLIWSEAEVDLVVIETTI